LLDENRFPRIWVPTPEERDARQLLLHRAKLVRMRSQVKNQLQALALNQGVQRKWKLWSAAGRQQLENLPLPAVGQPEKNRVAGAARSVGSIDRGVGPGRC
jgi:transposase